MQYKHIAFCMRRDYKDMTAGDVVQMFSWKKILEMLGNKITILAGDICCQDLCDVDVVFIWQLERMHESYLAWKIAKVCRKPIVLVPTCWREGNLDLRVRFTEQLKMMARNFQSLSQKSSRVLLFQSWKKCRDELLFHSSMLIVNSDSEKQMLLREGASFKKIRIIPNVVPEDMLLETAGFTQGQRSGIICVGHFCPRKNQLALIRSVKGTDLKITFVGTARPMHKHYYEQCRKEADGQHDFVGELSHSELHDLMCLSHVSVCVSLSETPGISNLEAAISGCHLVLPDIAPLHEYFGENVYYISPKNPDPGIIRKALENPIFPDLRGHILEHYTEKHLINLWKSMEITEG